MPINVEKLFENNYTLEEVLDQVRAYYSAKQAEEEAARLEKEKASARIEEDYIKASIAYFRDLEIIDKDFSDEEAEDLIRKVNKNIKVIFKNETSPIHTAIPSFKSFFEKF